MLCCIVSVLKARRINCACRGYWIRYVSSIVSVCIHVVCTCANTCPVCYECVKARSQDKTHMYTRIHEKHNGCFVPARHLIIIVIMSFMRARDIRCVCRGYLYTHVSCLVSLYIFTCIHAYKYIYTYTYTYTYIYKYICAYEYTYIYIYICVYMYMYIYIYICICKCIYIYIYIHM